VDNPREMAERLRREHDSECDAVEWNQAERRAAGLGDAACHCPADAHNAQLDALLAAIDEEMRHADRLAEALEGVQYGVPDTEDGDGICPQCMSDPHTKGCDVKDALSAHRARRGGQ